MSERGDNPTSAIAKRFVLMAIQDWGQREEDGIAAVLLVLRAAGFQAVPTCRPVFGNVWPKPFEGLDAEEAMVFMKHLTATMPRGKFETECAHVDSMIAARKFGVSGAAS